MTHQLLCLGYPLKAMAQVSMFNDSLTGTSICSQSNVISFMRRSPRSLRTNELHCACAKTAIINQQIGWRPWLS